MVLITGGTGFVGGALVRALAGEGRPVAVLTRSATASSHLPDTARICQGDMTDPTAVASAMAGIDAVVHLAAHIKGGSDPTGAYAANVEGTRVLAQAARAAGVKRFVHVSTASVYRADRTRVPHAEDAELAPATAYGLSKLAAERALIDVCKGTDCAWTILRPTQVYGAELRTLAFFKDVQRKPVWLHGFRRLIVHPVHVDDVVLACRLALDRTGGNGDVFNVGGERPLLNQEWIALVARLVGTKARQISLPDVGKTINRSVAGAKAREQLGLRPRALEQSVAECVTAFQAKRLLS